MNKHIKIQLIQPRHIYAPPQDDTKLGHIYMPTSLLCIAAILMELDVKFDFLDENIDEISDLGDLVGLNLLGAPYIPYVIGMQEKLYEKYGNKYRLLIGGQVVSGFSKDEFYSLFCSNTFNGNDKKTLSTLLGINESIIPDKENVSLSNVYDVIGDRLMRYYLSEEIGFYLSHGCKYSCSFCAAHRTIKSEGRVRQVHEVYRSLDRVVKDFDYLLDKTSIFEFDTLKVYLSNLDLFQNPIALDLFAVEIIRLRKKYKSIDIRLRGLSNTRSFLYTHHKNPNIIIRMKEAGLRQIGFGIDGATPHVYKQTSKPQSVQECLDAVRICREHYDITPEILMVFGHNNIEDEVALKKAVAFCTEMCSKYKAVPRPHIAKEIVPGNDGWRDPKNLAIRNEFLNNPMLFQNLDFTAEPSPITHADKRYRDLVTKHYREVCNLSGSLTSYVKAELPTMNSQELNDVRLFNRGRYDI